jgi:DNA processing protein
MFARNRIMAASTLGTVVTEASMRSGSMNTVTWARRCGRPVMAVPGPVTSAQSEGSHQLIKDRAAALVTTGADILRAIESRRAVVAPDLGRGVERANERRVGLRPRLPAQGPSDVSTDHGHEVER